MQLFYLVVIQSWDDADALALKLAKQPGNLTLYTLQSNE